MLKRQKQAIEAYQRVQAFLNDHPPPDSPGYAKQKKRFDGVVARLVDHAANQVTGRRLRHAEVARQVALRRTLREEHLTPVAQIARATLADAPGIEKALRMPDYYIAPLKLVAEARAMRAAAELYEAQFVKSGQPEDFLERLDGAVEALQRSVLKTSRELGRQVGATAGLEMEIRRGRPLVDIIDTIVRDAFRDNKDLLAQWRTAKRVRAVAGGAGTGRGVEVATLRLVKAGEDSVVATSA
jgi:hypothetical protein